MYPRDISVTKSRFGSSFGSDVGRLRPLQKDEQVVVAPGANVVGGWSGILF